MKTAQTLKLLLFVLLFYGCEKGCTMSGVWKGTVTDKLTDETKYVSFNLVHLGNSLKGSFVYEADSAGYLIMDIRGSVHGCKFEFSSQDKGISYHFEGYAIGDFTKITGEANIDSSYYDLTAVKTVDL